MADRITNAQLTTFTDHVIATLPDALSVRRTILETLYDLLPDQLEHKRAAVAVLVEHLAQHERAQMQFAALSAPTGKH